MGDKQDKEDKEAAFTGKDLSGLWNIANGFKTK
jgi:hypothetical protein